MAVTNTDSRVDVSGPTKQKYFSAGYRAAMADIARIVDEGAGDKPWETASARLNEIRDHIEDNSGVRFTDDTEDNSVEYDGIDEVFGDRNDPYNCGHCGLVGGH